MDNKLTSEQLRQKIWWEFLDLLTGALLPLVIMLLFSCTIIMFADSDDLAVQLVAVIGGDILLAAAYFIFGSKNGSTAYRKFYLNETKRALDSAEKQALYRTGEYSLWKGFVIPLISCVPYVVVQVINACAPNQVCTFLLIYAFGWAYFPFTLAGLHQALGLVMLVVPVAAHAAGYVYGKCKEEKLQAQLEATNADGKAKKKGKK